MDGLSLYIHIPFCRAKCAYCDFNSYPGQEELYGIYTEALVGEIEDREPGQANTIYVGGGTPTVLPLLHLTKILKTVQEQDLDSRTEITIEANPGTVGAETLDGLRMLGVNRLSLGIQSLDDKELQMLGRIHNTGEAAQAVEMARQAGFENLSLDLIYGLPGQSLASWQRTLREALVFQPDHLSLYALSIEEGTRLAALIERGDLPKPDPDLAAEMYEHAEATLSKKGFLHYEISNWARDLSLQCQHNLTYWRNEPYLGFGAGAHSWHSGRRWSNLASPQSYAGRLLDGRSPRSMSAASVEEIDRALEMGETMMMGLRLLDEGVAFGRFRERFGIDLRQEYENALPELVDLGLIEMDSQRVRLSRRGHLLGNQVFVRFLPDGD